MPTPQQDREVQCPEGHQGSWSQEAVPEVLEPFERYGTSVLFVGKKIKKICSLNLFFYTDDLVTLHKHPALIYPSTLYILDIPFNT